MTHIRHMPLPALSPTRFRAVLDEPEYVRLQDLIVRSVVELRGRAVWSISSTGKGGGVVELLRSLLAYARGAGIDSRWLVIEGDDDFFRVTKRLHNHLHGFEGDGGPLGPEEHAFYEATIARNAEEIVPLIDPRDVVLLHDPQTAGLVDAIRATGAVAIWRAHIGLDLPNHLAREAWEFLRPYVASADGYVFSRRAFTWEGLDEDKVTIIAPSIDAFSPKNEDLSPAAVTGILCAAGVLADHGGDPLFTRSDGTPGRVDREAVLVEETPLRPDNRVVLQVSRWDTLKDPIGVMRGFAEHVAPHCEAHLVLAGPSVEAVADDPEGRRVWQDSQAAWAQVRDDVRPRVHLASLPMGDGEENAAMVNALQRYATVVVQKSLAEGFGLTVAEAMWKGKPVVASRIGGIQEQMVDGGTGILLDDPRDLAAFGSAVVRLLNDEEASRLIGAAGRERVRAHFLGPRHLGQYFDLIHRLIGRRAAARAAGERR